MKSSQSRLRFLSVCIILFAVVLVGKLYMVEIVDSATYKQKAEHQYVAGADYFDRGSIFFTAKDGTLVPAASLRQGFILAIDPKTMAASAASSTSAIYAAVNAATPVAQADFFTKAAKTTSTYQELDKRISLDAGQKIEDLSIPGVSVYSTAWRFYPGGSLAAQTLGFEGFGGPDNNVVAGRYGLERFYESTLARPADGAFVNFFAEIFSDIEKTVSPNDSLEGDVVTSIEPSVQATLEKELKSVQDQYHSEFTGGIVIDPNTGEIYAMGLNPTFDPNDPQGVSDPAVFRNKLVEDRYEMGSIVKALTMAAGIDAGVVTPDATYDDPGCETLNKLRFCNYDNRSHGTAVSMQDVLDHSLNTGAAYVEQKLGNSLFSKYMFAYGVGSTTGVDLPNEGNSLVASLTSNQDLNYAEASFGQGIALTPMQTVRALSVLANGGYLITPHIATEIKYKIGTTKTIDYPKGPQVLKPSTDVTMARMLTIVADDYLANGTVRLANYGMGTKTGTAQIANPNGGYYADHYVHSFFGFFPTSKPRFLVFFYTFYPKNVEYASETLTPAFIDMAKFLINYYDIPPDRTAPIPYKDTTR